VWYLKFCTKCGGDMYSVCDSDGEIKECIQCGAVVYLEVSMDISKKISESWNC